MHLDDNTQYRSLNRWDIIQRFMETKASPIASFVLTMLRGKTFTGQKADPSRELLTRLIPMTIQDTYDALATYGARGLAVAPIAAAGLGTQTYGTQPGTSTRGAVKAAAKFKTVRMKDGKPVDVAVRVPSERAPEFAKEMMDAETRAAQALVSDPQWDDLTPKQQEQKLNSLVEKLRQQVRSRWLKGNAQAIDEGARTGREVELRSPEENDVLRAMQEYNRAQRSGDQQKVERASAQLFTARAALVRLTSIERAQLPEGLAPGSEGILGLDADATTRVAAALRNEPEMHDADIPLTASAAEVVRYYWDTVAGEMKPGEFKAFLKNIADEQQPPTEGAQLEPGSQDWWNSFHGIERQPSDEDLDSLRVSSEVYKRAEQAAAQVRGAR
jgi:hypothetical protein